ncbi:MAG: malonate decarboxylase acyl carrier protein [Neptuniibacter sp.]
MKTFEIKHEAPAQVINSSLVGNVGSGDLEVMVEPNNENFFHVEIKTSAEGSEQRWNQIFQRIETEQSLPAMKISIHDFAATPGVIKLRIAQALETALTGGDQ